jgi:hypothetical protein
MTAMTLAERLLRNGVPPSLLIDLVNPEGMRSALAAEVLASDVTAAPAPVATSKVRSA